MRRALVTGGSRGIGLAIVNLLKENGIEVLAPTRDELDLNSKISIQKYVKNLNVSIDILINNAGINPISDFVEINEDDIEETIDVNLVAPMLLCKAILPLMIKQGSGKIVNISSIWSVVSKPKRAIYASTKAAINAFTRTMAVEFGPNNILVNSIAPGFVNTELTKKNNSPADIKLITDSIPLRRLAEPSEIANLVYFLCSDNNTFITGQTILIDGGFTCQ